MFKIRTAVYLALPDLPSFRSNGWLTVRNIRYRFGAFGQFLGARAAKKVLTISDFCTREANEKWGISSEKLDTIGAGIDEVFCEPNNPPNQLRSASTPSFISVGRISLRQKPLDLVAEALADLSLPWRWTIVGSGPDEQVLRTTLEQLGLLERTVFLGTQESWQIAALLADHDIALLPSFYESFFITVYEAAAKAKIVVTNDVADVRKYFAESPSVIVAKSASREAYKEAIVQAVENFCILQAHAAQIAQRVKMDYGWKTIADRFLRALD